MLAGMRTIGTALAGSGTLVLLATLAVAERTAATVTEKHDDVVYQLARAGGIEVVCALRDGDRQHVSLQVKNGTGAAVTFDPVVIRFRTARIGKKTVETALNDVDPEPRLDMGRLSNSSGAFDIPSEGSSSMVRDASGRTKVEEDGSIETRRSVRSTGSSASTRSPRPPLAFASSIPPGSTHQGRVEFTPKMADTLYVVVPIAGHEFAFDFGPPLPPTDATKDSRRRELPEAPDLAQLLSLLAPHRNHRLTANGGCEGHGSLGEYVALLLKHGGEGIDPGDDHALTGGCGECSTELAWYADDDVGDPAYWYCRIHAWASDPEGHSPWHSDLCVRIRRSDNAVDLSRIGCPGAP